MTRPTLLPCIVLALTACSSGTVPKPAVSPRVAIFRFVDVAPFGRMDLGTPFTADSVSRALTDSVFVLKPGTFGGAAAIRIYVRPNRIIYAFEFDYDSGRAYADRVSGYVRDLGTPSAVLREQDGERTIWTDGRTRCEIILSSQGGVARVHARLADVP